MEERIRALLIRQNPWWRDKEMDLPTFERELLREVTKHLGVKQILSITGLRRVGKTVLMKQIIKMLDVPKNNKCYISFDDIDFQRYEIAEDLVRYFLEFSEKDGIRYLFLDEVQKLQNWVDLLKVFYDTDERLKIVISGSSSLEVREQKETLAGRILSFDLPLLTFREFVRYHGMDPGDPEGPFPRWYDLKFIDSRERYQDLFRRWLLHGAFPELLEVEDTDFIKRYIKESIIEKAIMDTARLSGENPLIIHGLLRVLAGSSAQVFEIVNLANVLKVNRNKVSRCVYLLEKSFLIRTAWNFTRSMAKQARTSKKQYLAHSSVVVALLDWHFDVLNTDLAGHLVEAVVANHMATGLFWRGTKKEEVDIVLDGKKPLPIEVKYRSSISRKEIRNLLKFCRKFKVKKGIIVTKGMLQKETIENVEILYIPAWLFMLYGVVLD